MIFKLGELFCGPGGIAWGATHADIGNSIIKLSINGQMIMMQVLVKHTDITFVVMNHRLCIMKISASLI